MTRARRRLTSWAAVALGVGALVLGAGCAHGRGTAESGRRERFEVAGDGALELEVPKGWKASVAEPGDTPSPRTVQLEPTHGGFLVLVTPFYSEEEGARDAEEPGVAGADTAQALVELARRKALQSSVEQEIALQELRGDQAHGYWFSATDKELQGRPQAKGEWRHIMQGAAAVGPLIVAFTLLDNAPGPQREAVLELVRGARHVAPAGGTGASDTPSGDGKLRFEPDPDARTTPLAVVAPDRRWAVLVDLPGFHMFKPRPGPDGKGLLVLGQDAKTGIVASVTLRNADGAADADGCRERTLEGIRKSAPDLRDLERSQADGAARARYVLEELRGRVIRQEHAHAFLLRDGTCVNVHVSKAEPEPEDAARIEKILASVRFGETF